jgi:sugar/nucleoside kinase (ribokinase family)
MLDVLCLGEALWDLHGPRDISFAEASALRMRPGGAAVNVAVRLAKRGRAVGLAAAVGADVLGEALTARVSARGVDVSLVERAPQRTGVVFVEHLARGRRIVGYRDADEPTPRLAPGWQARVLFVTGLGPVEEQAARFGEAAREARRQGALVVVDANARPRLWRGRAPGAALDVLGEADVVKASADDLATMDLTVPQARARLRADAVLVQTAGAGEATAVGAFGEARRAPRALEASDPMGAGDAFATGLLLALLDADATAPRDASWWEGALRRGHRVARAHLRRRPRG